MDTELITSGQNPKIKALLELQDKSRERRRQGLFVVEGRREIEHCLAAGFVPEAFFICPEIYGPSGEGMPPKGRATRGTVAGGPKTWKEERELVLWPTSTSLVGSSEARLPKGAWPSPEEARVFHVSKEVYEKIAYRGGTEGIVAEMKYKERTLEDVRLGENPLVVVLESVEKPGNLGAVLRSADAAGADAVIICDPLTDLYNPNLIRASIGSVFTRQVVAATSGETIAWLKAKGIRILTAQLQDSSLYYETVMTGPTAIVMGTESTGLTDLWREAADEHIRIPMLGRLDSLNVSVSAAILLFEAIRQRNS